MEFASRFCCDENSCDQASPPTPRFPFGGRRGGAVFKKGKGSASRPPTSLASSRRSCIASSSSRLNGGCHSDFAMSPIRDSGMTKYEVNNTRCLKIRKFSSTKKLNSFPKELSNFQDTVLQQYGPATFYPHPKAFHGKSRRHYRHARTCIAALYQNTLCVA